MLLFLRPDLTLRPEEIDELAAQASRPEVGVIGARIWSANDTLEHGGYIIGEGVARDAHHGLPRGHPGFFNRTFLQRNCTAVSSACLAIRAELFHELGQPGGIELCQRVRARGLGVVWTPYANPVAAAPVPAELPATAGEEDPFYSPNLSLQPNDQFELAFPPRWWRGRVSA